MQGLIADNILQLKGFHTVGNYKHWNGWGVNCKHFYANYYETSDGAWGFHSPRENGRGKGNLGELSGLSENKEIKKIDKSLIKEMERDERIVLIVQAIKKEAREERKIEKIKLTYFNEWVNRVENQYKSTISGRYDDDSALFRFEVVDNFKIKLVELLSDYTWSKRYSYNHKDVGDIVNISVYYNEENKKCSILKFI